MIYLLFTLLLTALVTLVLISYHKPAAFHSASFFFTRKCLGILIFVFAVAVISSQSVIWFREEALVVSVVAQAIGWIFVILTFRGILEILKAK